MKLDQPAMPTIYSESYDDNLKRVYTDTEGFTKRELAAIHLCVPDSGDEQLDAMIRRAQRDRLAGKIATTVAKNCIEELFEHHGNQGEQKTILANLNGVVYVVAEALIAAGEIKP